MGRFNKYSDGVEVGRKAEKKYLLGAICPKRQMEYRRMQT